jgi:AcrR family transcriptional regulator
MSETVDRLLRAAFESFGERGFDGASTRMIATRAGVSQQLITYHFEDKEGLWRQCVEIQN